MAKETRYENLRVVVTPDESCDTRGGLQRIANSIKRHIDGIASVAVASDVVEYCTLCGCRWDAYDSGLPGCCAAAQEEWLAQHPGVKV